MDGKATKHIARARELSAFGGEKDQLGFRVWVLDRSVSKETAMETVTPLQIIQRVVENTPYAGGRGGVTKCRRISSHIANNLAPLLSEEWEVGRICMSLGSQPFFRELELEATGAHKHFPAIEHNGSPAVMNFVFNKREKQLLIIDAADGGRCDVVIGNCTDLRQGPIWWHDGTFLSLYGQERHTRAKLTFDNTDDLIEFATGFFWGRPSIRQEMIRLNSRMMFDP